MCQTSGGGSMNFSINLSLLFKIHVVLGKTVLQSFSLLTVCNSKIIDCWLITIEDVWMFVHFQDGQKSIADFYLCHFVTCYTKHNYSRCKLSSTST